MKKLLYYMCLCSFCFILTIPIVSFADGVTSNGGVRFVPATGKKQESHNSETTEDRQAIKKEEPKMTKGILPKTNSETNWLLLLLGILTVSIFLLISWIRNKRLEH